MDVSQTIGCVPQPDFTAERNKDLFPKRLVGWLQRKRLVVPRIEITERCWSRTSERWWDWLDMDMLKNDRIAPINTYLQDWVKTNVELFEE